MAFNFTGKRILVTGATRGLGRQLAISLVKSGADVYALGRNETDLVSLKEECGVRIHPLVVDLADWGATRTALEQIPPMNGVVNNAGVGPRTGASLDMAKGEFERVFAVNFYAPLNVMQIVGKKMADEGKGGSIVNVSSIYGILPQVNCSPYCSSKAALDSLTKQFATELGASSIRVNSVNSTVMLTGMARPEISDTSEGTLGGAITRETPLGRYAEISECVNVIMFLLSDLSTMITGTTQLIDGGLLAHIPGVVKRKN